MAFQANSPASTFTVNSLGGQVTVTGLGASNFAAGAAADSYTFTSSIGTFSSHNVSAGTAVFTANTNGGSYGTGLTVTYTVTDNQGTPVTSQSGTINIAITASGNYTQLAAVSAVAKTGVNVTMTGGAPTLANLIALDSAVGTITVSTGSPISLTGGVVSLMSMAKIKIQQTKARTLSRNVQ